MFKCITGTGILALPYALALGRMSSLVLLIFFGILCAYTALKLSDACKMGPPYKDFEELGSASGPAAAQVMFFVQMLEMIGVAIVVLVLCSASITAISCFAAIPSSVCVLVSGAVATGLVYLCPNLSKVAWVASLGAVNIVFTLSIVLLEASQVHDQWASNFSQLWVMPSISDMLVVFGCVVFTFTAHCNFPIFVAEMKNPNNANRCFINAFACSIAFQVAFALLGFVTYGVTVNQTVNKSVRSSTLRTLLSASIICDKLCTYPIVYIPLELNCSKLLKIRSRTLRPLISAFIVVLAAVVGSNFADIMSLVGNVACSLDAFVFPVVFVSTLCVVRKAEYLPLALCVCVGLVALFCGAGADIIKMMRS
eukprot:GEMP01036078.1.p1 GENE.GEMP01036078.1~~GEMP01036078.1.p1  ORF type:complete len:400 (+),score=60.60 GEMP01036078.1:102-1202(+)